jgi:hypothetical protein
MKKFTIYRTNLILTIGLFLIPFKGISQDIKLTRQEQKEAKRAELVANFQFLDTLIEDRSFVLVADFLQNKYGDRIHVGPFLNFIRVDSTKAVLQTGSETGLGYNGVGGVTAEGRADHWKIVKNLKSLSYFIQFNIATNIGVYNVSITLNADNYARATITGITPGILSYEGHIEPVGSSHVFKGQNAY